VLLEIEGLTKIYRRGVRANDNISMHVDAGQIVGLLGHNGAGKTTLLQQVVGSTKPTGGTIRINGRDPVADPAMARRTCSLQPQAQIPLQGITPRQAIELMARIRGAGRRRARQRTDELLAALELEAWADRVGQNLSGGVQRLTVFCMAAAEPGGLVMFDEPTNDVDPVRRKLLWRQVQALGEAGCAVLLVTHNVMEAEQVVQRVVLLNHGRAVAQGTPGELRAPLGDRPRLELVALDQPTAQQLAQELTSAEPPVVTGRRVTVPVDTESVAALLGWAQQERSAGRLDEFAVRPVSLEDVYVRLIGSSSGTAEENGDNQHASLAA
jgi:ABC-2 type transport system ATP-binding protein